ncbi:acyl-CoA synthetase [Aromatoleum aromaticum]|uniref:Indoleacetate--CoA ligase n=1 Tax=Aromatoleum aromaticum (strain DSM 19018 / LMG 30748 / EbN1) TaxID=76114 RepID=IAAB_AROAE|nr:long-chain fatty acid--CoA ligase [Aromatoleum aromaticum]Q5P603.1 RecName: Full=Indoleacetate--CoA ligase [Aromatoleum aromaticum EbN1]NMG54291.1 long-chain-fatty-acid--CoA ligase [Aromatoleum aromaticum]CAI07258.1 putative ADP-producing CoA ligase,similar to feruloyl-CoA synthetase [Aromatoleum aromaticum EbN1]
MELSEWIDRHAGLEPGKTAIRFPERDLSYAQLAGLVERLASALKASGVAHRSCVAYLGYNSPEMLATLFACARLGALFMPLNWRLAGPEHRQLLADCPPSVLFVEPRFVAQIDAFRDALADVTLVAFDAPPQGWISYEALLERSGDAVPRDPQVGPQTPLLICYTSGTTGKPKGALLSQGALAWNAVNSIDLHELSADDRILTTLPLFHVGGLNNQTTPALSAGATVVLHPKFDADATFDAIEQERITLTVLVPAQLEMMIARPRWQSADLSSLRMITTGSTIVPERLIREVHRRGVPLVQIYGSTETCPIAAYVKPADAQRKAGSAGRAAPHCSLRIVGDDGHDVKPGATGEILVRGPNVMNAYWNDLQASAAVLKDGWFRTGDMGHQDGEGYLWVDGRKKEMIISGGENIYPAEIENLLGESPDIAEVAVVGRLDERWGEVVVAVVVPLEGRTLDAGHVLQLLEGRIARYKLPKEVVFLDELPRTALGKVRKDDVRQLVARKTFMEQT